MKIIWNAAYRLHPELSSSFAKAKWRVFEMLFKDLIQCKFHLAKWRSFEMLLKDLILISHQISLSKMKIIWNLILNAHQELLEDASSKSVSWEMTLFRIVHRTVIHWYDEWYTSVDVVSFATHWFILFDSSFI